MGWGVVGRSGGRGHMEVLVADSCYMAEANTIM